MCRLAPLHALPAAALLFALLATPAHAQCELELQELSSPDGAAGDVFGYRIDRLGSLAAVAATFDDDNGVDSGSVWIAELAAPRGWHLTDKLLASDGAAGDAFGYSVAVDRRSVLVGAPQHDENGADSGAVYVFERGHGGRGWHQVAHFTPPDAGPGASFGYSMAAHGDRVLVGAPHHGLGVAGRAYLYRRDASDASGWALESSFTSEDPATALEFGQDVALGDAILAVSGSETSILPYSSTYVVHVREHEARGPRGWRETVRLSSPTGSRDLFGWELSIEGERLAVAAPAETNLQTGQIGAVYLYRRVAPGRWPLQDRLAFRTEMGETLFAPEEVDLRGDWIVVGSADLFVFGRNVGGENAWGPVARISVSDPDAAATFGLETSLEGDSLLVGSPGRYDQDDPGELYVYDLARLTRATWRNDARRTNPDVLHSLTRPLLGTTWLADVDLRPSGRPFARLSLYRQAIERRLPRGSVLLGTGLIASITSPGPVAHFAIPIPPSASLCGRRLTTQAALLDADSFELSNAEDLVLGFE